MMCDECGIRPATIRLMSIVDGEKTARSLCAHCLADVKKSMPHIDLSGLDGMLASLLAATKKMGMQQQPDLDITCQNCGTTYEQFQKSGLLGCAGCYEAFQEPLEELLKQVHGQTQHMGKAPGVLETGISHKISIYTLKQQLKEAIAAEEYEQAAVLRDRIRQLISDQTTSGHPDQGSEQEAHMHDGL